MVWALTEGDWRCYKIGMQGGLAVWEWVKIGPGVPQTYMIISNQPDIPDNLAQALTHQRNADTVFRRPGAATSKFLTVQPGCGK